MPCSSWTRCAAPVSRPASYPTRHGVARLTHGARNLNVMACSIESTPWSFAWTSVGESRTARHSTGHCRYLGWVQTKRCSLATIHDGTLLVRKERASDQCSLFHPQGTVSTIIRGFTIFAASSHWFK